MQYIVFKKIKVVVVLLLIYILSVGRTCHDDRLNKHVYLFFKTF
jgi:hypothetical protein